TFLRAQADAAKAPLDVTVAGHSKGGALAPTVALWLREALEFPDECWDKTKQARVSCYAFAGPTPGNGAFADRLDAKIGSGSHYTVNANDVVPHAFQVNDLKALPALYGDRTRDFQPLVDDLIAGVGQFDYRHPKQGVRTFNGKLDNDRTFAAELIHQHLDAYL